MKQSVIPSGFMIAAATGLFMLAGAFSRPPGKLTAPVKHIRPFLSQEKKINIAAGSILGIVVPFSVKTAVRAVSVSDTMASTYTDTTNGAYILKDVPPGNYALIFIPADPVYNKNSCRAAVSEGQITVADTIWLRK